MYKKIVRFAFLATQRKKDFSPAFSAMLAQIATSIFKINHDLKSSRKQSGVLLCLSAELSVSWLEIMAEAQTGSENSWRATNYQIGILLLARPSSWPMPPTFVVSMASWSFAPINSNAISSDEKLIMKEQSHIFVPDERLKAKDSKYQLL